MNTMPLTFLLQEGAPESTIIPGSEPETPQGELPQGERGHWGTPTRSGGKNDDSTYDD